MPIEIKQNEPLAKHNTFAIGGPADYFAAAKSPEEIMEAVAYAKKNNLPYFVLGGGSNILISDSGYRGLIIKIQNRDFKIEGEKITAGAGAALSQLMNVSAERGLSGLEWAVGIPGTIGGAVNGNCGAYGRSISESAEAVSVLDESGRIKKYSKADCGFNYRSSKFKNLANKEIIIEVELKLAKGEKEKIKEEIKNILMTRKGKVPPQPSAGCVFKNIKSPDGKLVAAVGKLVDQCGLKGSRMGGAAIPQTHGNYVVNMGGAKAEEVRALINVCKEKVKEKFGFDLEEEIVVL